MYRAGKVLVLRCSGSQGEHDLSSCDWAAAEVTDSLGRPLESAQAWGMWCGWLWSAVGMYFITLNTDNDSSHRIPVKMYDTV